MSVKTISQLQSQIQTSITSNTGTRGITAPILGGTLADMVDSLPASDKNAEYVTCSTVGGTDAKTIDLTDFNLSTGVRLLVKMEHAVTSGGNAISLEINSSGAKPLIYNGVAASSSNTWSDNDILDIYYNGTQYVAVPFLGADDEPTENSRELIRSGGVYDAIAGSAEDVKDWADDLFAKQDGSYDTLAAGTAKNLEGGSEKDWTGMGPHVTGNDTNFDFGNGLSEINKIEGNSASWNQRNNLTSINWQYINRQSYADGFYTVILENSQGIVRAQNFGGFTGFRPNDKLYIRMAFKEYSVANASIDTCSCYQVFDRRLGSVVSTILNTDSNQERVAHVISLANTIETSDALGFYMWLNKQKTFEHTTSDRIVFSYNIINLSLLGIDNYTTVAQVEGWLDKNVGLKPYYPYDAGSLLSVKMQGIKTVGRNLCSVSGTTGTANLPAYDYDDGSVGGVHNRFFISGTYSGLSFTDCYGVQSNPVPDSDGLFTVSNSGVLTVSGADSDVYVCMDYDGTYSDSESYVPYEENTRYIDVTHIYGKLNGEGNLVQVFPDGMRGVKTVHDEITDDGTAVVRIGNVNLGTLSWQTVTSATVNVFKASIPLKRYISGAGPSNICCSKQYSVKERLSNSEAAVLDMVIAESRSSVATRNIVLTNNAHTSDPPTSQNNWVDGIMLDFELATPLEYTDLVYQGSSYYADGTPVELGRIKEDNWGTEEIVPKNPDGQAVTMCSPTVYMTYALDAVETIKTMIDSGIHTDELKGTMDNFLSMLNSKLNTTMGGDITISDSPVDKVFSFGFTPTPAETT